MKVLRHGNMYKEIEYLGKEIECLKCGALLFYCKADIKVDHYGKDCCFDTKRNIASETYVTCPECKKKIILERIYRWEKRKI